MNIVILVLLGAAAVLAAIEAIQSKSLTAVALALIAGALLLERLP